MRVEMSVEVESINSAYKFLNGTNRNDVSMDKRREDLRLLAQNQK